MYGACLRPKNRVGLARVRLLLYRAYVVLLCQSIEQKESVSTVAAPKVHGELIRVGRWSDGAESLRSGNPQ